jgi:hypothetical protein
MEQPITPPPTTPRIFSLMRAKFAWPAGSRNCTGHLTSFYLMFTLVIQYVIRPVCKATRLFSALQTSLIKRGKRMQVGQVVIFAHVGREGMMGQGLI